MFPLILLISETIDSLLQVITVVIVWRGVVAIFRVVDVVLVVSGVGVALNCEIGVHSEEVAVPRRTLAISSSIFFLLAPVRLLSHRIVSWTIFAFVVDHGSVRLKIRPVVPDIKGTSAIAVPLSENEAEDHRGTYGPEEESPACVSCRFNIRPVINKTLHWEHGNASRSCLHATTNNDS